MFDMEINEQVGETAGKIWHLLNEEGPQTLKQLKKRVDASGELASFAVGWLAREGKVGITQEKKTVTIVLK
jgi:predicted ArsR family transcriptional regulator